MELKYEEGQRIKLKGGFEGYPATVTKVNDHYIVIQFDDLTCPTSILMEQMRQLEIDKEVEIED